MFHTRSQSKCNIGMTSLSSWLVCSMWCSFHNTRNCCRWLPPSVITSSASSSPRHQIMQWSYLATQEIEAVDWAMFRIDAWSGFLVPVSINIEKGEYTNSISCSSVIINFYGEINIFCLFVVLHVIHSHYLIDWREAWTLQWALWLFLQLWNGMKED